MNDKVPKSFLDNPTLYEGTYLEFLGFRLTAWKEGFARLEMPVRTEHRNTVGYLHGGVIASLLDIAGARTCRRQDRAGHGRHGSGDGDAPSGPDRVQRQDRVPHAPGSRCRCCRIRG